MRRQGGGDTIRRGGLQVSGFPHDQIHDPETWGFWCHRLGIRNLTFISLLFFTDTGMLNEHTSRI